MSEEESEGASSGWESSTQGDSDFETHRTLHYRLDSEALKKRLAEPDEDE